MTPTIMAGLACSMGQTPQSRGAGELALGEKDETRRDSPLGTAKIGELAQTALLYLEDEILSASAVVDTCSEFSSGQIGSSSEQQNGPPSIPVRRSSVAPQKTARFKKGSPCMRRKALMNSMYLDIAPAAHPTGHNVVLAVSEAVALLRKGEEGEGPPDTRKKGEGDEKMSKVELWLKESRIIGNTFAVRYRPSIPTLTSSVTTTSKKGGVASAAEAMPQTVSSRHDRATDVETTPPSYPVLGGPNQASITDGSPGGARGKRKSEMNWRWIMQGRQNSVDGVLGEDPKIDAKKKKRAVGFSVLGRAIKMAVGGSPKREKPPDINDPTTTPPSPNTSPPKKRRWTTTINEKYHQILSRRLKPKPRRYHSSDPADDEEDPCSLGLPSRRPNTALGIYDIDRSPYLSDLVPFLPDEEEEQYTPTWIKENLSRLFHERSKPPVGQRRPASAPCLDYCPVGPPRGCWDGEISGMGRLSGGDGCRRASPGPPMGRRSVSAPGGVSGGGVGGCEGDWCVGVAEGGLSLAVVDGAGETDREDGGEGYSAMRAELREEEDESMSDVSRSTEAVEEEEAGNEKMSVDDVEVSEAEEGEGHMTNAGEDAETFKVGLEGQEVCCDGVR
ncbi:hypothetical protein B0T18DRAFT_157659 [Schizothecium vesticola]|uniref:Uncharacterized protein n=1 Tax=Schizothecium vesticola TaxID=314040 RepID=A0AA40K5H8_9PEZI|nr:hypothetical protein B0T18DRAFT_157659 [Schizothecium vesticola]